MVATDVRIAVAGFAGFFGQFVKMIDAYFGFFIDVAFVALEL